MDYILADISDALSASISTDGQTPVSANIPMGGFKITNIGAATALTDAARADQVQKSAFIYGASAGGTADAITINLAPTPSALASGMIVNFFAASDNTGACTLNVNSLGATAIRANRSNAVALGARAIRSAEVTQVYYDGVFWRLLNGREGRKTWVPTITPGGTMTWTPSSTAATYEIYDGRCYFYLQAVGTVGGTPDTSLAFTLPVNSSAASVALTGLYLDSAGLKQTLFAYLSTVSAITIYRSSGALTAGANQNIYVSGSYEVA